MCKLQDINSYLFRNQSISHSLRKIPRLPALLLVKIRVLSTDNNQHHKGTKRGPGSADLVLQKALFSGHRMSTSVTLLTKSHPMSEGFDLNQLPLLAAHIVIFAPNALIKVTESSLMI